MCHAAWVFLRLSFYRGSQKSSWKKFSYTRSQAKEAIEDLERGFSVHYGNDYSYSSFTFSELPASAMTVQMVSQECLDALLFFKECV